MASAETLAAKLGLRQRAAKPSRSWLDHQADYKGYDPRNPWGEQVPEEQEDDQFVLIGTTAEGFEDWEIQLRVPNGSSISDIKQILALPPHRLAVEPKQRLLSRLEDHRGYVAARDSDPAPFEALLFDFRPPTERKNGASKPVNGRQREEDAFVTRETWETYMMVTEGLKDSHASQAPRERRGHSWGRTLSFAKCVLGSRGMKMRRGSPKRPFVVWVLGATAQVEVSLAQEGFLVDANWVDRAATQVVLFGKDLDGLEVPESPEKDRPKVHVRGYDALQEPEALEALTGSQRPDLVAVLMPDAGGVPAMSEVLEGALASVANAPIVVSTRFKLSESAMLGFRRKLGNQLVLPQMRCPFSAAVGDPRAKFDDNGWIFGVRGPDALACALSGEGQPESDDRKLGEGEKLPALFWGILDVKYDPELPVLERVAVLETGDGRTSKFSGAGAEIPVRLRERYSLQQGANLQKYSVISMDKKLTHDFMRLAGYGHIVPMQACFARHYEPDLADRIVERLQVSEDDYVVLKLCNRSRAAGVIVVPVDELDEVLEEVLVPPQDMDAWLQTKIKALNGGSAADWDVQWGSFDEQCRHWWSNESPVFVVERWRRSMPTLMRVNGETLPFDGTMRVVFALRHRNAVAKSGGDKEKPLADDMSSSSMPPPEDLEVQWMGGYWKLPKQPMNAAHLRERVVSAARTSGTATVSQTHLAEVYAAMGDSVQGLFGGLEPTVDVLKSMYTDQPELASFLTARLAMSQRDQRKARSMLVEAAAIIEKNDECPVRRYVESSIRRYHGVLEAKECTAGCWDTATMWFNSSLQMQPANANTLHLLGIAQMENGNPEASINLMTSSLLLDPDFKAPYVNLGAAYLRLGSYDHAIDISEACLIRHPESPQCHYHISLACCQQVFQIEAQEATGQAVRSSAANDAACEALRQRALRTMQEAREHKDAQQRRGIASPWLELDDRLVRAMEARGPQDPPAALPPSDEGLDEALRLPPTVGWTVTGWR